MLAVHNFVPEGICITSALSPLTRMTPVAPDNCREYEERGWGGGVMECLMSTTVSSLLVFIVTVIATKNLVLTVF